MIPTILQRTGDIPLRSTDRLILIDVVYHHHPSETGSINQPTVVRSVHRVGSQIIRPDQYCQFLQDECIVHLEARRWPQPMHSNEMQMKMPCQDEVCFQCFCLPERATQNLMIAHSFPHQSLLILPF